jgi:nitronate monooxygenase
MALRTPLCDILGVDYPIIQAPIGSAASPQLAAAVSNAGALGMLALSWRSPADIRGVIRETRELADRPFGVNLVLTGSQRERLECALDEGVRIVSFFWGDPTSYVERVHDVGGIALHTVGTIEEARDAIEAGVDVIVAQGWEAGGHVRSDISTIVLVPSVVDAVGSRPVVAAGGIADGRGVAAALTLGAQGAWVGTRFLASQEAAVHPDYRKAVIDATISDTLHTMLFDIGWPHAPHRVIRNRTVDDWLAAGAPLPGSRPGEGEVVGRLPNGNPVVRYSDVPPLAGIEAEVDDLALYAGQSAGLVSSVAPAGDIVRRMVEEADRAFRR